MQKENKALELCMSVFHSVCMHYSTTLIEILLQLSLRNQILMLQPLHAPSGPPSLRRLNKIKHVQKAQAVYLHSSTVLSLTSWPFFLSFLFPFTLFVGVMIKGGAVLSSLSSNSTGMIKYTRLPCLYLPAPSSVSSAVV